MLSILKIRHPTHYMALSGRRGFKKKYWGPALGSRLLRAQDPPTPGWTSLIAGAAAPEDPGS